MAPSSGPLTRKISPMLSDFRAWAGWRQQWELTHFVFLQGPAWFLPSPNDLFGIYQQSCCKCIQQSTSGIELYTQTGIVLWTNVTPMHSILKKKEKHIYIHISSDGWFDSTCCFSIIISKEKVGLQHHYFVTHGWGGPSRCCTWPDTAANQDGACVNIGHNCSHGGLIPI